jgi:hypothetical protein
VGEAAFDVGHEDAGAVVDLEDDLAEQTAHALFRRTAPTRSST